MKISGGRAVVEVLQKENVNKIFGVPGESYLEVLDALYQHPRIEFISTRHEGGASFMAEGYAKASGKVGVCMATRGPGATNLSIGLHTAQQDSTPLVALIGQVDRPHKNREAFQEIDLAAYFSHLCKWTVEIDRTERIPELLHRAFHIARTGRPGPVLVSLPEDMLTEIAEVKELHSYHICPPEPNDFAIKQAVDEMMKAKRPIIIAGGGVIQSKATAYLIKMAESLQVPVATAFRRLDAFPNSHPLYAGSLGLSNTPGLVDYVQKADLVVAIGTRFSQITSQDYTLIGENTRLIHVDISPDVIGKVYAPFLPVVSDSKVFLQKVLKEIEKSEAPERKNLIKGLHEKYMEFSTPTPEYSDDYVDMDGMMYDLVKQLPKDSILTCDAGNFFSWQSRYYRFEEENTFIGPTSGAMGYGLPAAIGAKLSKPEKTVVSFSGDGGFMMTLQEFETAVRYDIPILAIVVNNNMYGTIRMHQEKHHPDRQIATELTNPCFSELAKQFGGYGERVERNAEFLPALERALSSGKPALIEVMTNPEIISANHKKVRHERI
ncbi:thiamine pyrophosphate-dependent enzyme [Peribacillus simplex]|uniref:thiamine pyrophosphate-dependent enzyme n=1 Tax=Peribacillus simplex TaxID=1478 RepID=UPI00333D7FEF